MTQVVYRDGRTEPAPGVKTVDSAASMCDNNWEVMAVKGRSFIVEVEEEA